MNMLNKEKFSRYLSGLAGKHILLFSGMLLAGATNAQNTFQKYYGGAGIDLGSDIAQTTDGGYIISGMADATNAYASWMAYLIKIDANGDTMWTKTYDVGQGVSAGDTRFPVVQTNDGGYAFAATSNDGISETHPTLVKLDMNGDTLWKRDYNLLAPNGSHVYSMQQTSDNGYIIFGANNLNLQWWYYLLKTDVNGNLAWTKMYKGKAFNGNTPSNVHQTNDNGYVFVGSTADFGAGGRDVMVVKTDANGTAVWTKAYGGSLNDEGYYVQQTSDNGYIITGATRSFGAPDENVYVIKTDANGDTLWTQMYNGTGTYSEIGQVVHQTADGGYFVAGSRDQIGDIYLFLLRLNNTGTPIGTNIMGGDNTPAHVLVQGQPTTDGGYVTVATKDDILGNDPNIFVAKLDSVGDACWPWFPTITQNNTTTQTTVGVNADTTIACNDGYFWWFFDFAYSTTVDSFFCYCGAINAGFSQTSVNLTATFTNLSSGSTSWLWDFGDANTSPQQHPVHTYASAGTYNVCLTAYNDCDSSEYCNNVTVPSAGSISNNSNQNGITIYPNPTTGQFTVSSRQGATGEIQVYDLFGRKLLETTEQEIDMRGFAKGVYVLRMGEATRKIILQ